MQNTKVFTEVANDGRFPYIDALPLFAQGTVKNIEKLPCVKHITATASHDKNILALNVFFDRPRLPHHIDLIQQCFDRDFVTTNYYSLVGGINRITIHLIPSKNRLN